MFRLGGFEWIVILLIILLVFGPGRIGKVAGELGKSIKSFRDGLSGNDEQSDSKPAEKTEDTK